MEFDPTSYTVNESNGYVEFIILKKTTTTQPVTIQFTTQLDTGTGESLVGVVNSVLYFIFSFIHSNLSFVD